MGKAFEKQTKTIEDQGKNQISAIKESVKQIIESNEVAKNDFDIVRSSVYLEFSDIKDKIDPNNLVYTFKTDKNEPKDFGNYQTPLKLFEDLRDGNINPKEVLKNQTRFKLDLSEIKIGGKQSPNQKNTINNITNFFYLREKTIVFLEIILFCSLKLSTKQNMDLKY